MEPQERVPHHVALPSLARVELEPREPGDQVSLPFLATSLYVYLLLSASNSRAAAILPHHYDKTCIYCRFLLYTILIFRD